MQSLQCPTSFLRDSSIHTLFIIFLATKEFLCSVCSKQFIDAGKLSRHIKEVHEGKKSYFCGECEKGGVQYGTLQRSNMKVRIIYIFHFTNEMSFTVNQLFLYFAHFNFAFWYLMAKNVPSQKCLYLLYLWSDFQSLTCP